MKDRKHTSTCFNTLGGLTTDIPLPTLTHVSTIADAPTTHSQKDIKRILISDIRKKYNLKPTVWGLYSYSIEILRSLLVFGEHEIILKPYRK